MFVPTKVSDTSLIWSSPVSSMISMMFIFISPDIWLRRFGAFLFVLVLFLFLFCFVFAHTTSATCQLYSESLVLHWALGRHLLFTIDNGNLGRYSRSVWEKSSHC